MQIARVVEILRENKSIGSGYLITPHLVLTARHVVSPEREGARWLVHPIAGVDSARLPLHQRKRPRALAARVAWRSPHEAVDLAILELADGETAPELPAEPVTLGRAPHDCGSLPCVGHGFPSAAGADDRRVEGLLSWSFVPNRFDLDVSTKGPEVVKRWGGMSGAAIFVGDILVGVVSKVDPNWREGKLEATPVEHLDVANDVENREPPSSLALYLKDRGLRLAFVSACATRLAQGWLAPARLAALVLLLDSEELPKDLLQQLYRSCLPASAALRGERSLRSVVAHLAEMPLPADGGPPPLCRLVREIADRRPALAPALENWLQRIKEDHPDIALAAPAVGTPADHNFYVAVVLDKSANSLDDAQGREKRIERLAHIRIFKDDGVMPLPGGWDAESPVSLEELREALLAQLNELLAQLAKPKRHARDVGGGRGVVQIIVEFCLPHALLAEPFDEWPIPCEFDEPEPLGAVYPVVLRDIDRTTQLRSRQRWAERWERLRQIPPLRGEDPYWVSERDNMSVRQLFDKLVAPEDGAEPPFCIGLGFPADADWLRPGNRDFLCAAWSAGLPAAVWFRAPPGVPGEAGRLWRSLMDSARMDELPRRLREEREKAHRGNRNIGVSLVWDDPEQIRYCVEGYEGSET
ncbi:trypsin-like peptidase domain-containing protein [Methylosinus sp. H3A]|uniref:VMAP-C domain-containing protein n=1 Tax=Methylosinus sp. H3A TaxID=2785786 RepID=UPI0018C225AC|nr:trypsin-like peptidase domain-containing protein [Methylosinus sp. H3A]MBG0811126.1 trypsin-like peptidase domain-containing protein [Methylosinus sp. H3A]